MRRPAAQPAAGTPWIHSTRLHVVLYSFLLVFTPFIVLQNFLMDFVSHLSATKIGGIPSVPLVAAVAAVTAAILFRHHLTKRVLAAAAAYILMDALAQRMTDYYFGEKWFDLLQNWHYIAYGLFGPMIYRDLSRRGVRLARIFWIAFFCALFFSSFDEFFQRFLSNRVFDLSDIAKDVYGCVMGLVVLSLVSRRWAEVKDGWQRLRSPRLREHLDNPLAVLFLLFVFALIFLSCGSLLSDPEFPPMVFGLTFGLWALTLAVYFGLIHRASRIAIGAVVLIGVITLGISLVSHRNDEIVSHRFGLTVYRGLPIPFFDVLIFPDGRFRLADKKHSFTNRDQQQFLRQKSDIILVGSGDQGLGGKGFPEDSMVQFVRNPYSNRFCQLIILKTPDACRTFNRLKREGKNVVFVLHNTC